VFQSNGGGHFEIDAGNDENKWRYALREEISANIGRRKGSPLWVIMKEN
jgi:hypothetical protein